MVARHACTVLASLLWLGGCRSVPEDAPGLVPVIASGPYTAPEKPRARARARASEPEPACDRPPKSPPTPELAGAPTPGSQRTPARVADAGRDAPHRLPPFEVHERGFTDFGLSVVTNVGVARGRPIEWMRVGEIAPGSSASFHGLRTGDDILAIDDTLLSEVSREEMLRVFFQRERNDRLKLVIFGGKNLLPRIVRLTAGKAQGAPHSGPAKRD